MSQVCVKLRKPNRGLKILSFSSFQERNEWLRSNGFYEANGVHLHLDGSIAGLFSRNDEQMEIAKNCDKPIKSRSAWRFLCNR